MGVDTYRKLGDADPNAARRYLDEHFGVVFAEAIAEFSFFGYLAITVAAVVMVAAFALWVRLRHRLPWHWIWLLPLVELAAYAALEFSVVFELIRLAPELPQMWGLYVKSATPFRMVRTPASGLVALSIVMWLVAWWRARQAAGA